MKVAFSFIREKCSYLSIPLVVGRFAMWQEMVWHSEKISSSVARLAFKPASFSSLAKGS